MTETSAILRVAIGRIAAAPPASNVQYVDRGNAYRHAKVCRQKCSFPWGSETPFDT